MWHCTNSLCLAQILDESDPVVNIKGLCDEDNGIKRSEQNFCL